MSSLSRQQLEAWIKTLDIRCDKVLDIGGSQNPIRGRTKNWEVNEYKILDLEVPHECKEKPDIVWDINDEITDSKILCGETVDVQDDSNFYDAVFCIEVMEYLYDPIRALKNIRLFLKTGGKVYLSFHFFYPYHKPVGTDFLRYTPEGVLKLLEVTGFKLLDFQPRTLSENAFALYTSAYLNDGMKRSIDSKIIGGMLVAEKI